MAHSYEVRAVHKINPRHDDVSYIGRLGCDLSKLTTKELAHVLRREGHLAKGQRLNGSRVEPDGRIVAFPANHNGLTCYPHALIIRPIGEALYYLDRNRVRSGNPGEYGNAREYSLLDTLTLLLRPFSPESSPYTLIVHEVWYTGAIDGDDRERHVREVGGFFVGAGVEYVPPA